jgi:hypothetical protein
MSKPMQITPETADAIVTALFNAQNALAAAAWADVNVEYAQEKIRVAIAALGGVDACLAIEAQAIEAALDNKRMEDGTMAIKVTLSDGRQTWTGPIQGNGGLLGAGVPDRRKAAESVRVQVNALVEQANEAYGLDNRDRSGVTMYPDYCAEGNGGPVVIPLAGKWLIKVE